MTAQQPRRRPLLPRPDETQVAEIEEIVAAAQNARIDSRPDRVAVLEIGPPLRDIDAAADCSCGCHPRPADQGLHDGGTQCPCQHTAEDRQRLWAEFSAATESFREHASDVHAAQLADLAETAAALGVDADVKSWGAPFALTGVCDGHSFYLRERHDLYRVEVAVDAACEDLWGSSSDVSVEVVSGSDIDLHGSDGTRSASTALRIAVDAVRLSMRRNRCSHEQPSDDSHGFCRRCGVNLDETELWRWPAAQTNQ